MHTICIVLFFGDAVYFEHNARCLGLFGVKKVKGKVNISKIYHVKNIGGYRVMGNIGGQVSVAKSSN